MAGEVFQGTNLTYLLVSHDRYLLENTCNRALHRNQRDFPVDRSAWRASTPGIWKNGKSFEGQRQQQQTMANKVQREVERLRKRGPKWTKAKYRIDEAARMMAGSWLTFGNGTPKRARSRWISSTSERRANKLITLENVTKSRLGRRCLGWGYLTSTWRAGPAWRERGRKPPLLRAMAGQQP
ncbi:MAG: hypothetical protein U1D30_01820 [Planctomycetota bacterium]